MNEATGGVKRAVVIGAGFGGLALAIRLQRAGTTRALPSTPARP